MVIGNGMIARRFADYDPKKDVVVFASGVSSSIDIDEQNYLREKLLLTHTLETCPNSKFIYFSSVMSTSGLSNRYLQHKKDMEIHIESMANNYLIFRLPQIVGSGGNKKNIVNYFDACIKNGTPLCIQNNTYRALLDIDDMFQIIHYCVDKIDRSILNVSYIEKMLVSDIVQIISDIRNKPANIKLIPEGASIFTRNSLLIEEAIKFYNIDPNRYTYKVLHKYLA